jgi:hypothetical protein
MPDLGFSSNGRNRMTSSPKPWDCALPQDLFAKLFSEARDAVQQKLAAANPTQVGDIRRVLSGIAADAIGTAEQSTRDYSAARDVVEALHASRALDESQVRKCLRQQGESNVNCLRPLQKR